MTNRKNIVWLASYPKSGNTWFRIFLSNLLADGDEPVDINMLNRTPIASSRNLFDDLIGIKSSDLTSDEIDLLRPEMYRRISHDAKENIYLKIHDAFTTNSAGETLIPKDVTSCALYFIRNPMDVAVSFAHHSTCNVNQMIRGMNNPEYKFASQSERLHNQLTQKLLTWSGHVKSWTEQDFFPVHVIRYEDLLNQPLDTFKKAVHFIGLNIPEVKIEKATKFSTFAELQRQEKEKGFKEKAPKAENFFRKGEAGSYKEKLHSIQIRDLTEAHAEVMKQFGYLGDNGELTV